MLFREHRLYSDRRHRLMYLLRKPRLATLRPMTGRYREHVYTNDARPRWVAVYGLQWEVIESQRLVPAADLLGAMRAAIERMAGDGWRIEAEPRFGFAFIRRDGERRLLMLTPRSPCYWASFNPFK
jgi:hypothetical protein